MLYLFGKGLFLLLLIWGGDIAIAAKSHVSAICRLTHLAISELDHEKEIRQQSALRILGKDATPAALRAVELAHVAQTIAEKARILSDAGVDGKKIRQLMEEWVVGNPSVANVETVIHRLMGVLNQTVVNGARVGPALQTTSIVAGDFRTVPRPTLSVNGHELPLPENAEALVRRAVQDPTAPHRWYSYDPETGVFYKFIDKRPAGAHGQPELTIHETVARELVEERLNLKGAQLDKFLETYDKLQSKLSLHAEVLEAVPTQIGYSGRRLDLVYRPHLPSVAPTGTLLPAEPARSGWQLEDGQGRVIINDPADIGKRMGNGNLNPVSRADLLDFVEAADQHPPRILQVRAWHAGDPVRRDVIRINGRDIDIEVVSDPNHGLVYEEMILDFGGRRWVARRLAAGRRPPAAEIQDMGRAWEIKLKEPGRTAVETTRSTAPRLYVEFSETSEEVTVWTVRPTH